jgi:hypothetical protein
MLQKLSDIPQWQNNKLDLFPLSIYGGEISKLNPEDQIDDELDKLWEGCPKPGEDLVTYPDWEKLDMPIAKAIAKATSSIRSDLKDPQVAIANATWQTLFPGKEFRPVLSTSYELSALVFNTMAADDPEEKMPITIRFEDPAGAVKQMTQQGTDGLNIDNRANYTVIEIEPKSVIIFPSYLTHTLFNENINTINYFLSINLAFPHRKLNPAVMEHNCELEKESLTNNKHNISPEFINQVENNA